MSLNPFESMIATMARARGLDPYAVLGIGSNESGNRRNAVGDNGTSFGPFQLHVGGALPSGRGANWADSRAGIAYALNQMAQVARGLHGNAAISAISQRFERPANPAAEIAVAERWYHQNAGAPLGAPGQIRPSGGALPARAGGGGGGANGLISALMANNASYAQTGQVASNPMQTLNLLENRTGAQLNQPSMPASIKSPAAEKALSFAKAAIGTPYVWGGESSKGYDCSGLVQAAMRAAGITVGRTTYQQIQHGAHVAWGQFRPGDLIFSNFEGPGAGATHVVIYLGHGRVIAAPHTGTNVQIESVNDFKNNFVGARRYF